MKKILIIATTILMVIALIVNIYPLVNNTNNLINKSEDIINEHFKNLADNMQDIPSELRGTMQVEAKYKGAHGEVYPAHFTYNYELDGHHVLMENEEGYYEQNYHLPCIDFFLYLKNLHQVNLKDLTSNSEVTKIRDGYQVNLDMTKVNAYLQSHYTTTSFIVKTSGLSQKIKSIVLTFDNDTITMEGKILTFNYANNKIIFTWNNNGYSLNINDEYRMNVFNDNSKKTYSIVKGTSAFQITSEDNTLKFISNTPAAIYNGLDIIFDRQEVTFSQDNSIENPNDNPLVRYFSAIDFSFWR